MRYTPPDPIGALSRISQIPTGKASAKTMQHDVRAHINGEWLQSTKLGRNCNPARRTEPIGTYPMLDDEHARAAVAAAAAALPAWRMTPAPQRARYLATALALLQQRRSEIAAIITREQGKTLREAEQETDKAIEVLEFTCGEGTRQGGHTVASAAASRHAFTVRQPLGVVALITPWNFPVSIPIWKIAPALVAGNTVVLKPASLTPWCAETVVRLFIDAGVPRGVINLVTGDGAALGSALLDVPELRGISFTGSTRVGLQIGADASRRGLKAQCEMGGKNALVVLEDADLEQAARAIVSGAFGAAGQRCTATSRVIVIESVADRLLRHVTELTRRIVVVGDGAHPSTTMGPLIHEDALQHVLEHVGHAKAQGATLILGGERLRHGALAEGCFMAPTIFDHVQSSMRIAREEIFGPVLGLQRVRDFDAAIAAANATDFGLCASLYSRDMRRAFAFIERIETGIAHINGPNTSGEAQLPFGGVKASGLGARELGHTALDFYSELKTVYLHLDS